MLHRAVASLAFKYDNATPELRAELLVLFPAFVLYVYDTELVLGYNRLYEDDDKLEDVFDRSLVGSHGLGSRDLE